MPRNLIRCIRCGYTADRMNHYQDHIRRKKPCPPVLTDIKPTLDNYQRTFEVQRVPHMSHVQTGNHNNTSVTVSGGDIAHITQAQWITISDQLRAGRELEGVQELMRLLGNNTQASSPPLDGVTASILREVDAGNLREMHGVLGMDLPPEYTKNRSYVYLIGLGFDVASRRMVVKYGKTEDLLQRCFETHKRSFPHSAVLAVVDLGMFSPTIVETSIKVATQPQRVRVRLPGSQPSECFMVPPDDLDREINRILWTVCMKHGSIIQGVAHSNSVKLGAPLVRAVASCRLRSAKLNATIAEMEACTQL